MSRKHTKHLRKTLDAMLEQSGLGCKFFTSKQKKGFLKYLSDIGETLPPKDFHTNHNERRYAFSKGWKNVNMKFDIVDLMPDFSEVANGQDD